MATTMSELKRRLLALSSDSGDQNQLAASLDDLDRSHALMTKWEAEPGLADILEELYARLLAAFGDLRSVEGLRILDIACGSSSSHAPPQFHLRTAKGRRPISSPIGNGFAAVFEPWFPRILLTLGAEPVGVDRGDLSGERFEAYNLDLGQPGALDFLPANSFDAVQDSRLFGSPEFRAQFPKAEDRLAVAREIVKQEVRLLKQEGKVIHSDARDLIRRQA